VLGSLKGGLDGLDYPDGFHVSGLISCVPTYCLSFRSKSLFLPMLSKALDRWNDLPGRTSGYCRPMVSVFSPLDHRASTPLRPAFLVFELALSFVLGSLVKGLGLSTGTFACIVSLRVWGILS